MTSNAIRVEVEQEDVYLFATSRQIDLLVSGDDVTALRAHAAQFAEEIFRVRGEEVSVSAFADVASKSVFWLKVRPAADSVRCEG